MNDLLMDCFLHIRRNRLRSFLTILSITIGVTSVLLVSSIGQIGTEAITREISSFGVGSLTVSANRELAPNAKLTGEELEKIKTMNGVQSAIPIIMEYTHMYLCGLMGNSVVWGIGEGSEQVISLHAIHGRLFTQGDIDANARVCIVDENTAKTYYKRSNIVGKTIDIAIGNTVESFEVVGVAESGGSLMQTVLSAGVPGFVYVPYTAAQQLSGRDDFDQIAVKLWNDRETDEIGGEISQMLGRSQGMAPDLFPTDNMYIQKQRFGKILSIISLVLSLIAAISLLVAGLGIMTTMMMIVRERTREIGIKKAIGASQKDILMEFFAESLVLSGIGSGAGAILSIAVIELGGLFLKQPLGIPLGLIVSVFSLAVLTGGIFGVYPAMTAAKLKPIDALRTE